MSFMEELQDLEPLDGHLFVGEDGEVSLGCAECGYGNGSPGTTPWDRPVGDLYMALRMWTAHRRQVHS